MRIAFTLPGFLRFSAYPRWKGISGIWASTGGAVHEFTWAKILDERKNGGRTSIAWVKRTIPAVLRFPTKRESRNVCPIVTDVYGGVDQWSTSGTRQSTECKNATNRVPWLGVLLAGTPASITSSPDHCQVSSCQSRQPRIILDQTSRHARFRRSYLVN